MSKCKELLKSEECIAILSLLSDGRAAGVADASLFERFSMLCRALPLLEGNKLKYALEEAICEDTGSSLELSSLALGQTEIQKEIWRALYGGEPLPSSARQECASASPVRVERAQKRDAADVYEFIRSFDGELEDAACELAKKQAVRAELGGLVYFRPDAYHCSQSYLKLANAQILTDEERSALIFWVICRALMKGGEELYLKICGNLGALSGLLALLEQRRIFPRITLEVFDEDPAELSALVRSSKRKNIYVVLLGDATDKLSQWQYELPLNRLSLAT